jgi:hypothetical protein
MLRRGHESRQRSGGEAIDRDKFRQANDLLHELQGLHQRLYVHRTELGAEPSPKVRPILEEYDGKLLRLGDLLGITDWPREDDLVEGLLPPEVRAALEGRLAAVGADVAGDEGLPESLLDDP